MPIYEKIQKIREGCLNADWSTDKTFPKGGKMIPFVSGEKIKRTFAPWFAKYHVDLSVRTDNVVIHPDLSAKQYTSTLSLDATFILTDTEDGSQDICTVPGFGPADDLHGPKTALSFAYNTYMTMKFQICDRTDDMVDDVEGSVIGQLMQKSVPEVKAVPTNEKETKGGIVAIPISSKSSEKDSNRNINASTKFKATTGSSSVLTIAEKKAVANSVETATKWLEEGKIIESQFEKIKNMADSIKDSAGVYEIISEIRTLKKDAEKQAEGF